MLQESNISMDSVGEVARFQNYFVEKSSKMSESSVLRCQNTLPWGKFLKEISFQLQVLHGAMFVQESVSSPLLYIPLTPITSMLGAKKTLQGRPLRSLHMELYKNLYING